MIVMRLTLLIEERCDPKDDAERSPREADLECRLEFLPLVGVGRMDEISSMGTSGIPALPASSSFTKSRSDGGPSLVLGSLPEAGAQGRGGGVVSRAALLTFSIS